MPRAPSTLLVALAPLLAAAPARADERPELGVAVGAGVSVERGGNYAAQPSQRPLPAVFGADGEIIDDWVGLLARLTTESGESTIRAMDRVTLTAAAEVRPWALLVDADGRWGTRLVRRLAFEFGLAYERDSARAHSGDRADLHLGAHADLPIAGDERRGVFLRITLLHHIGIAGDNTIDLRSVGTCPTQLKNDAANTCGIDDHVLDVLGMVAASF